MIQVDKSDLLLSTYLWLLFIFIVWYFLVFSYIYPIYYKTLRGRAEYECFAKSK